MANLIFQCEGGGMFVSRKLNMLKIVLPFIFLFLLLTLIKTDYVGIPDWFPNGSTIMMAQDPPFRGLGKDTLGEEFTIFKEDTSMFPERLGDMHLIKVIVGQEALDNVQSFQGTSIDIAKAYIPHYQTANRQAIIWITESHDQQDAKDLIQRINLRIPENENFYNDEVFYKNGIKVYKVERMGWFNYYYRNGNRIYWAAIQDDNPRDVLILVLDAF